MHPIAQVSNSQENEPYLPTIFELKILWTEKTKVAIVGLNLKLVCLSNPTT